MKLFVVMGVSGCGKSSVAQMLAQMTDGLFIDADDYHTPESRKKMAAGIRLDDVDRWKWLDLLNNELKSHQSKRLPVFLACSALRRSYRKRLSSGLPSLTFIYLHGSKECILRRIQERQKHFMPPVLLDSQFEILEEPTEEEAIVVSVEFPLLSIVTMILNRIQSFITDEAHVPTSDPSRTAEE